MYNAVYSRGARPTICAYLPSVRNDNPYIKHIQCQAMSKNKNRKFRSSRALTTYQVVSDSKFNVEYDEHNHFA